MLFTRNIPNIRSEYFDLRRTYDDFLSHIDKKDYDLNDKLEQLSEDKKLNVLVNKVQTILADAQTYIESSLETQNAKGLIRTTLKRVKCENNPFETSKKPTLGSICYDFVSACNYLKLEISLHSILATKGNLDDARSLTKKSISSIKATSEEDTSIFNSAAMVAKVDGIKLTTTKNK